MSTPESETQMSAEDNALSISPLRCFTGAFVAGSLSLVIYRLMNAIAQTFAAHPMTSDNPATINIAAAVRTLVVGMAALGAGVFGFAGLGLAALGLQLVLKRLMKPQT